jgi:hypothetical protein
MASKTRHVQMGRPRYWRVVVLVVSCSKDLQLPGPGAERGDIISCGQGSKFFVVVASITAMRTGMACISHKVKAEPVRLDG